MKQPAISSVFNQAKHYSQPATTLSDKKNYIAVAVPAPGKPLVHDSSVKATGKMSAGKAIQKILLTEKVIAMAPTGTEVAISSQKTAVSTKQGKGSQPKRSQSKRKAAQAVIVEQSPLDEGSFAAADTLSLNSNSQSKEVAVKNAPKAKTVRKSSRTKKRTAKQITKDQTEVQLTKKQLQSNDKLKKIKLAESGVSSEPVTQPAAVHGEAVGLKQKPSSAMAGLSAQTQALLQKALVTKKPLTPQQPPTASFKPSPAHKRSPSAVLAASSSPLKQISVMNFSDLPQEPIPELDSASENSAKQERKPLMIPHPSDVQKKSAVVSSQTLDLIKKIRTQGKTSQADFASKSPISDMLSQQNEEQKQGPATSPISNISNATLRQKYSELLKVKREIVLPLHMKQVLEASKFIDESLNFLQRCRHTADQPKVLFRELKASVEKTFARSISMRLFRQILTIAPDFYNHSWEKTKGEPALAVEFSQGSPIQKNLSFFTDRQEVLRQRLTDQCVSIYKEFVKGAVQPRSQDELDLIQNPLKYQMWHHSFDPHKQVAELEEATLKAPPATIRSQNVNEFLGKKSMPALVQDALAKAQADQEMKESGANKEEQISSAEAEEDEKLQKLCKSTGLSIETLRMIKKVETKVTQHKQEAQKTIDDQMDRQQHQTLTALASQIRYIFQMRRTGTLQINILLEQLNQRRNTGEFIDKQERMRLIEELAQLVPRWLQVKSMPSYGKIVKCQNNALNHLQVSKIIQDKVGLQAQ